MTRFSKTLSLFIALAAPAYVTLAVPAFAAPGQEPRQDPPRQAHRSDYWLSRDMQRLVFWQPHDASRGSASRQ